MRVVTAPMEGYVANANVRPGDLVLFHSFLPHLSHGNSSSSWRRLAYLTYNAASEGDFESVKAVGDLGLKATICGLSRTRRGDIEAVARSLDTARDKRLHIFIATSPIHREYKLKMSKQQIIDEMCSAMAFGKQ